MGKIKIVAIILGALILLGAGTGVWAYASLRDLADDPMQVFENDGPASNEETAEIPPQIEVPVETDATTGETISTKTYGMNPNLIVFALFGVDKDSQRGDSGRTDTVVVCAVDTVEHTVKLVTLPRDTQTTVRHLDDAGNETHTSTNKINTAYAFGGKNKETRYGNAMVAIEDIFQRAGVTVPVKYYAGIDMDGISEIADAVGGIELTLPERVSGFGAEGETIKLSGQKAEDYVRKRHGVSGGSDLGRAKRQQGFLLALAQTVKKMGAIQAVPRLYGELQNTVDTNFTTDQMIALATVLNGIDFADIQFTFPEGVARYEDGKSYYFIDDAQMQTLLLDIFYKDVVTESPAPGSGAAAPGSGAEEPASEGPGSEGSDSTAFEPAE